MVNSKLRITQEKVDFFPPDRVTDDRSILTLKSLVLEPLCTWINGVISPGLFSHWETNSTGLIWHFYLRNHATFHDGSLCVASDIVDFLHAICQSVDTFGMPWSYASYFKEVVFQAISSTCLRVETRRPMGDLPEIFSEFYPSRTDVSGHAIIGTGPYKVVDFTPGLQVTLLAVSDPSQHLYFRADKHASDRMNLLRRGEADVACQLDALSPLPEQNSSFRWLRATHCLSVMAYLNCTSGLFADTRARQAVNLAVDRTALCEQIYKGMAIPASTIVSPFHIGFNHTPFSYDPEKARHLFRETGRNLSVTLRTPEFMPEHAPEISAFIKAALEAAGVTVNIDIVKDRPDYARQIGRKEMGDIALFDSSPHSTFRVINDKISCLTRGIWWQGYENLSLEHDIAAANTSLSVTDRATGYSKCLTALQDDPPWLYLVHPDSLCATAPDVHGISINHKGFLEFDKGLIK
ncbi:ABC transporter substrate-binding protein [Acetobacter thailandicus]|uniref:ABC transporter substrate-binding protein n=1 Tax=Acetobacter thailandicus TaxID=1502842 RepID=UPI001BA6C316|nr:hypothetical protein [Acetobacter thailandicus]